VGGPTAGGAPSRGKRWKVYRYKYGMPRRIKKALVKLFEDLGLHVATYWDRDVEIDREEKEKYIYSYEVVEGFGEVGKVRRVTVDVYCTGHDYVVMCWVYRVSGWEEVRLESEDDVGGLQTAIDRALVGEP
jgi:hypothetical protein